MSSNIICVNCGTVIEGLPKGCLKQPYCEKCFKEVWNDDYDAYKKWLAKTFFWA